MRHLPRVPTNLLLTACCAQLGAIGCQTNADAPLVLAAGSMQRVIESLRQQSPARGEAFRVSFAASSTLARQIAAGAGADVYISANRRWVDYLQERGLLAAPPVRIAENRLQLVASRAFCHRTHRCVRAKAPITDCHALSRGRIAIGDPRHVPAGIYAKQALDALGCYERIKSRLYRTTEVRAALRLAVIGQADLAIVYQSDHRASAPTRGPLFSLGLFDPKLHQRIEYFAARLSDRARARKLMTLLQSASARALFAHHGFSRKAR